MSTWNSVSFDHRTTLLLHNFGPRFNFAHLNLFTSNHIRLTLLHSKKNVKTQLLEDKRWSVICKVFMILGYDAQTGVSNLVLMFNKLLSPCIPGCSQEPRLHGGKENLQDWGSPRNRMETPDLKHVRPFNYFELSHR